MINTAHLQKAPFVEIGGDIRRGNYVIFVRSIQTLQLILLERELIALFNGILIVKKY